MEFKVLTEADWRARHVDESYVSASQVATIMGENPYESGFTLYQRKTGAIPDIEQNIPMRMGHALESLTADLFTEQTGQALEDPGDYAIAEHPECPHIYTTLDRFFERDGGVIPVELKAQGVQAKPHWIDGGQGPTQYRIQLQMQMYVCEATAGTLAGLVGNQDFFYHEQERNDDFIKVMVSRVNEFRDRCLNGDAPEMDSSDSTVQTMLKLHPKDNGETVERHDLNTTIEEWLFAKDMESKAKKTAKRLGNQLRVAINENTFLIANGRKLSYKHTERAGYTVAPSESRTLRLMKGN